MKHLHFKVLHTICMHQFGWLSERAGNFLNLLQKEGIPRKLRGFPHKRGGVPFSERGGVFQRWRKLWLNSIKLVLHIPIKHPFSCKANVRSNYRHYQVRICNRKQEQNKNILDGLLLSLCLVPCLLLCSCLWVFLALLCISLPRFYEPGLKEALKFAKTRANKMSRRKPMYVLIMYIKNSTEPIYVCNILFRPNSH